MYPKLAKGVSLDALHNAEMELRSRFSDWSVFVVPPAQALPSIFFETGKSNLSDFEQEKIKDIVWILHRWDIKEVSVVGYASTVGEYRKFNNNSLAYQRAKAVFDLLEKEGVKANLRSEYASFDQRREEMVHGIDGLHRVEVRLIKTPDFPDETEGNSGNLPAGIEGTK